MTQTATGIDVSGRVIILSDLQQELVSNGVPVPNGLTIAGPSSPPTSLPDPNPNPALPDGSKLFTYDDQGNPADLPPEAAPIVEAYSPAATKPA
jgi:hypothetical protein